MINVEDRKKNVNVERIIIILGPFMATTWIPRDTLLRLEVSVIAEMSSL